MHLKSSSKNQGLLYESCVEYCQARATNSVETYNISDPNVLLMNQNLSETDASLLSWLHALTGETFSCPFEEKPLKLNLDKFVKPALEATWAEAILATPIKPQQLFPYNAVPSGRSRNTELMSRSLAPQYEGLTFGMTRSQLFTSGVEMKLGINPSLGRDVNNGHSEMESSVNRKISELTRSIGFFSTLDTPATINNGNGALSNENNQHLMLLNDIKEEELVSSPTGSSTSSNSSSHRAQPVSAGRSMSAVKQSSMNMPTHHQNRNSIDNAVHNSMHDSQLFQEYRKHKAQVIQQIEEQEKKRDEYVKQLKTPNVQNALNSLQFSISNNKIKASQNNNLNDDESFMSPKSPYGERLNSLSNATANDSFNNTNNNNTNNNNNNNNNNNSASIQRESTKSPNEFMPSPQKSTQHFQPAQQSSSVKSSYPKSINEATKFESLEVGISFLFFFYFIYH